MVAFKRPDRAWRMRGGDDGSDEPDTFDFLGFIIHWGKSPMTGKWVVKTRTAADRFRRALRSISQWCKEHRHPPLPEPPVDDEVNGLAPLPLRDHFLFLLASDRYVLLHRWSER